MRWTDQKATLAIVYVGRINVGFTIDAPKTLSANIKDPIITRQIGEELHIRWGGHKIRLRVTQVHGGQVKIAFEAPKAISIDREEIDAKKMAHPHAPDQDHPRG